MSGANIGYFGPRPDGEANAELRDHLFDQIMAPPTQAAEPMGNSIRRLLAQTLGPRPEFAVKPQDAGPAPVAAPPIPVAPRGSRPLGPAAMAYNKSLAGHSMTKPLTPAQQKLYEEYKNEAWANTY